MRLPVILRSFLCVLVVIAGAWSCTERPENSSCREKVPVVNEMGIADLVAAKEENQQIPDARRDSVNDFLDKPFDLHQFKEKKRSANSGGAGKRDYYFLPDTAGMYYRYFVFSNFKGYLGTNKDKIIRKEDGLIITVYKKEGKYQFVYSDPTEVLIEVRAKFNDFDLPELAFVGLDSSSVTEKLGKPDLYKNDCIVYQHNNKVLVLKLSNKKVVWLKYIHAKSGMDISEAGDVFEI